MRAICLFSMSFCFAGHLAAQPGSGPNFEGTLLFTVFNGQDRLQSVDYLYDGATFTLSTPLVIATVADGLLNADGVDIDPNDGLILVAGQNSGLVYKVDPTGPVVTSTQAGGTGVFHLSVDPDLSVVWTSAQPGNLKRVPIGPAFGTPGTVIPIVGDDTLITQVHFTPLGTTFYTRSDPSGIGNFGIIDLSANPAQTTRLLAGMAGLHGGVYDPFSGDLMLFGDNVMLQVDIVAGSVIASRSFPVSVNLDQGAVDGLGHVFIADNNDNLVFMDYSATGQIDDPTNFVSIQFLADNLDDVAPLLGPPQPCLAVPNEVSLAGATTVNVVIPSQPGGGVADVVLVPLNPSVVESITPRTFDDVSLGVVNDLDFEVLLQCISSLDVPVVVEFAVLVGPDVLCETSVLLDCAGFVEVEFLRGDCNNDGIVNIADVVWTISQLFSDGASSTCHNACDSNDDESVDLADAVYTAYYRFLFGPEPPTPFPFCGSDPTPGPIDCQSSTCF